MATAETRATSSGGSQLRLLVADDSEDDYELLLRELGRGGYVVSAERVVSAEELAVALERAWDLIVTDWVIPGLGGHAVLAALAARRVAAPCIVVAGMASEEAAVQALRAGALDFLSKDKLRLLVPAVQRALVQAAESRARAEAERELRLSEERYRRCFEVSPEILLTYDVEHTRVLDANTSALRFFQCSLEELRAVSRGAFSPPVQPDGRSSFEAGAVYIAQALRGEDTRFRWTFSIGGEVVPAEITITSLPTSSQHLARSSIVDLRERLRVEEILEANRRKGERVASISRELRAPLDAIIGLAERLRDGQIDPASPEHRELLGDLLSHGRHLRELADELIR